MILYDLAKQLKNAGFPLRPVYGSPILPYISIGSERYLYPNLEEVIAECNPSDNYSVLLNVMGSVCSASRGDKVAHGKTPLEAVCMLYLDTRQAGE